MAEMRTPEDVAKAWLKEFTCGRRDRIDTADVAALIRQRDAEHAKGREALWEAAVAAERKRAAASHGLPSRALFEQLNAEYADTRKAWIEGRKEGEGDGD